MTGFFELLGLLVVASLVYLLLVYKQTSDVEDINYTSKDTRSVINQSALPILEDSETYIEEQTKIWIGRRNNDSPCYGLLEKDKIVMTKWMQKYNISCPTIFYYGYHDEFTKDDLLRVFEEQKNKRLIIKASHLQSSFGIIATEKFSEVKDKQDYIDEIYEKCIIMFKGSFVCNHDKNDPPSEKQVRMGIKPSYYKLYETIKPGVVIQEFFYSEKSQKSKIPIEKKILMFGDKVICIRGEYFLNSPRNKLLFSEARRISKLLGAHLIRTDFFVKKEDNIYKPYLNEISLSPNGGLRRNYYLSNETVNKYMEDVKKFKPSKFEFLDELIENCPKRDIPIEFYYTENGSQKLKFKM